MARIISIASQKGGVGKTTTALNLGYSLSRLGSRVLLLDGDPQAGMSIATNLRARTEKGVVDVLRDGLSARAIVMQTREQTLAVAGIGQIDPESVALLEEAAGDGRLASTVRAIGDGFDYVLIDAPAGVSGLVTALLMASDSVIIVVTPRLLSLTTLPVFLQLLVWVQEHGNPQLQLEGVLVAQHDRSSETQNQLNDELRTAFPAEIFFAGSVPADELFEKASVRSLPVALMPNAVALAKPYVDLAVELKERELAQPGGGIDESVVGLF